MFTTLFVRLSLPFFALLLLAACAATPEEPAGPTNAPLPAALDLPDLGPAPEITNKVWINSDEPLTLASQRGKVVLVEFWTFG